MEAKGDEKIPVINESDNKLADNLKKIEHKIVVMSGKGGVGKSTVAANLAVALSMKGLETGLLDVDIHGPSIPMMLKIEDAVITGDREGLQPVIVPPHLRVMSMAFLLQNRDLPVIWRGPMKMGVIKQFLEDVRWGELDFLIADLPPGTGDEPLSIAQLIKDIDGTIIVTTPQDVALLDARKATRFSESVDVPVLGIVENMSGFTCPNCGEEIALFKRGGGKRAAEELEVPFLGSIPLDGNVVQSSDDGTPIVLSEPESETAKAFLAVAEDIIQKIQGG